MEQSSRIRSRIIFLTCIGIKCRSTTLPGARCVSLRRSFLLSPSRSPIELLTLTALFIPPLHALVDYERELLPVLTPHLCGQN